MQNYPGFFDPFMPGDRVKVPMDWFKKHCGWVESKDEFCCGVCLGPGGNKYRDGDKYLDHGLDDALRLFGVLVRVADRVQ